MTPALAAAIAMATGALIGGAIVWAYAETRLDRIQQQVAVRDHLARVRAERLIARGIAKEHR